jgi:hypothetical protein
MVADSPLALQWARPITAGSTAQPTAAPPTPPAATAVETATTTKQTGEPKKGSE